MKTKILSFLTLAAFGLGFGACTDKWEQPIEGEGSGQLDEQSILLDVVNAEVLIPEGKGFKKSASRAVTDLSGYIVTVEDANGAVVESWKYSAMPSMPVFNVGTYTVKVKSHEVKAAEWSAPYFVGSQSFSIRKDEVTELTDPVVCKLANIAVSVKFADDLLAAGNGGADFQVEVTSAPGVSLTFGASETRKGYFEALDGLSTLHVVFNGTINGTADHADAVLTNVAGGQHRQIVFALKSNTHRPADETGNLEIGDEGIKVDFSVVEEDMTGNLAAEEDPITPGYKPGEEDPENPDKPDDPVTPTQPVAEFTSPTMSFETMNYVSDFADEDMNPIQDAKITIKVPGKIQELIVNIVSDELNEEMLSGVGLSATLNLAHPASAELGATLANNFGFPTGDEVIGKEEITFEITKFVPLLMLYPDAVHSFVVKVIDQNGKEAEKELKFHS